MSNIKLTPENLDFYRGMESKFSREEFCDTVAPYLNSLLRVNRYRFLCAFKDSENKVIGVTGYATDTTINATINDKVLEAERTGGRWVIYQTKNFCGAHGAYTGGLCKPCEAQSEAQAGE